MSKFQKKFKEFRIHNGLSQKHMAELLNVTPAMVCKMERGESFSVPLIKRVADIMRVKPETIKKWMDEE